MHKIGHGSFFYLNEALFTKMCDSKNSNWQCVTTAQNSLFMLCKHVYISLLYIFVLGMWTSFEMCEELIAEVLNFPCLLITYFTFLVRYKGALSVSVFKKSIYLDVV